MCDEQLVAQEKKKPIEMGRPVDIQNLSARLFGECTVNVMDTENFGDVSIDNIKRQRQNDGKIIEICTKRICMEILIK